MSEQTRGQLIAAQIKAHPELGEQEIAAMIDAHIQEAVRQALELYLPPAMLRDGKGRTD